MPPWSCFPVLGILEHAPAAAAPLRQEIVGEPPLSGGVHPGGGACHAVGPPTSGWRWPIHGLIVGGHPEAPPLRVHGRHGLPFHVDLQHGHGGHDAPIARRCRSLFARRWRGKAPSNFPVAPPLGIAYVASIGGCAILIGTPPKPWLGGGPAPNSGGGGDLLRGVVAVRASSP